VTELHTSRPGAADRVTIEAAICGRPQTDGLSSGHVSLELKHWSCQIRAEFGATMILSPPPLSRSDPDAGQLRTAAARRRPLFLLLPRVLSCCLSYRHVKRHAV
jgi:hypothetical protein